MEDKQLRINDCKHQWHDIAQIWNDGTLHGLHCCLSGGHSKQYYWCLGCGAMKRDGKKTTIFYPMPSVLNRGDK